MDGRAKAGGMGMGMERDFAWGDGRTVQCTDDVLWSCTLEACMVLQTSVTPIKSIRRRNTLSPEFLKP